MYNYMFYILYLLISYGYPLPTHVAMTASRTVGIDTYLRLSGDPAQDFARIREFYAGKRGRRPENEGDIRLRL